MDALIDSGSSESFIHPNLVQELGLQSSVSSKKVAMASTSFSSQIVGTVNVDLKLNNTLYSNVKLSILHDLCVNVILGLDFQTLHQSVTLSFGGRKLFIIQSLTIFIYLLGLYIEWLLMFVLTS